jgi:hypothetical protein
VAEWQHWPAGAHRRQFRSFEPLRRWRLVSADVLTSCEKPGVARRGIPTRREEAGGDGRGANSSARSAQDRGPPHRADVARSAKSRDRPDSASVADQTNLWRNARSSAPQQRGRGRPARAQDGRTRRWRPNFRQDTATRAASSAGAR